MGTSTGSRVLGRVAIALMFPAATLPAVLSITVLADQRIHPLVGHHPDVTYFPAIVAFWILLGSMALNGFAILAAPATRATGTVPARLAIAMLALDVAATAWGAIVLIGVLSEPPGMLLDGRRFSPASLVAFGVTAALSVVVFALALAHWRSRRLSEGEFDTRALRGAAVVFALVAVVVIVAANTPGLHNDGEFVGDVVHWSLILVGLPWSWLEAPFAAMLARSAGIEGWSVANRAILSIPAVLNVVLVTVWLVSRGSRRALRSAA